MTFAVPVRRTASVSRSSAFPKLALPLCCAILLASGGPAGSRAGEGDPNLARARQLVDAGQPAQAAAIYEELLRDQPDNLQLMQNLAVARFKAAQYRETIETCRRALAIDSRAVPVLLFLGASHYQLREFEQAVGALERALDLDPGERNARLMVAEALLVLERPSEALAHFKAVTVQLPEDPRVWYGLNRTYAALRLAVSSRLATEHSGSGWASASQGWHCRERGNDTCAVSQFREALARSELIDSRSARDLRKDLAVIERGAGSRDSAPANEASAETEPGADCTSASLACLFERDAYSELLDSSASDSGAEALYWRERSYAALARRAEERLRGLPESPQVHELRARSLLERGLYRLAAASWQRALQLDPSNVVLQTGLANALYEGRDFEAALPVLDGLLSASESADLRLLRGSARLNLQRVAGAVPDLVRAVELDPSLEGARAELSRAYMLQGTPGRAAVQLEAILEADRDGSYHYRLARAYRELGRQQEASAALEAYRRIQAEASRERAKP